jgi:hypothetical protein
MRAYNLASPGLLPLMGLVLLVTTACEQSGREDLAGTVVTDSAGVRLVRNTGPDIELPVREALRIGVVEGEPEYVFHQIRSLALDSSGAIWVSDSHESLRRYEPDGTYLGKAGGRGPGPGETLGEGYGDIYCGGGTILAYAYEGGLQSFSLDGVFLGSRSVVQGPGRYLLPIGKSGEDWNFRIRHTPFSQDRVVRESWILGRGPADAPGFDSVATLPGSFLAGTDPSHRGHASFFYGRPDLKGDADGRFHYSHAMDYRIDLFDGTGELRQVITRDTPPTPYPGDMEERIVDGMREGWREFLTAGTPPPEDRVREAAAEALPDSPPNHLPFLEAIFVSAEGHIWALRGDRHRDPAMQAVAEKMGYIRAVWPEEWRSPLHLDLFSPDGIYRGSVVLPEEFVPMAVNENAIFGSTRDELDVQYVVGYSVSGE